VLGTPVISRQNIAKASSILIGATLLSRLFGFLREVVIADRFGASATTDAFFVALTIPVLFSDFIKYSVKNSFVPVFSHYRLNRGDSEVWGFAWRFTRLLGIGFIIVSLGLFFGSPQIITLIAPGAAASTQSLAIQLMRFLSFLVILLGLASILESIYNGFEHFIIPAFAPLALNISVILAVLIFSGRLGALGIALGLVTGGILQLFILARLFRIGRFSFRGGLRLAEPEMKRIFILGLFIALVQGIWGFYYVLDRILASSLPDGSISALAFADRLIQLPVGVFVLALSVAALPRMSISVAQGNYRYLERICSAGLRLLLFVVVPITMLFCIMRYPLIRVLYQRGSFGLQATDLTVGPLFTYSLGLSAFAAQIFILRVYFAFQDMRTPLLTSLASLCIKVILSLILMRTFAATGIALATSIAASCNTILLAILLNRKRQLTRVFGSWHGLEKLLAGWIVLGATSFIVFRYLGQWNLSSQFAADLIRICGTVVFGGFLYLGTMVLLRSEEIRIIRETLLPGRISRASLGK